MTLVLYKLKSIEVGVIAVGQGSELRSNSKRIWLSPVPELEVPKFNCVDNPRFAVAEEEISASGTAGTSPVELKTEPRDSVTE